MGGEYKDFNDREFVNGDTEDKYRPQEHQITKEIYGFEQKSNEQLSEILNIEANHFVRLNPDYVFIMTMPGKTTKYGSRLFDLKFKRK